MQSRLKGGSVYILTAVSIARFLLDRSVYSVSFLYSFLILILVWNILRTFLSGVVSKLSHDAFAKETMVYELKPGMVLSEVIERKGKIGKAELERLSKDKDSRVAKCKGVYYIIRPKSTAEAENFLGEEAEGLTPKQISRLKRLGIESMKVSQTMPFAPSIFLGALITLLAEGNILILVKGLIL